MEHQKRELTSYFESMSLFVLSAFLFVFPLLFLSNTTDAFVLPKQVALIVATSLFVVLFGLRSVAEGKLKLKSSPFDVPVILFLLVNFVSALLSVNRFDALAAFLPILFVGVLYFGVVNVIRNEKQLLFLLSALIAGAFLAALVTVTSFFNIYLLPFSYAHVPYFTTFGSLLDQAVYFALLLPIVGFFTYGTFTSRKSPFHKANRKAGGEGIAYGVGLVVIGAALVVTLIQLFTTQKPLILPFDVGLQTGLAAISQDTGNVLKSFFLGSGTGTYLIDFTRFKPATYNANAQLWSFTFFRSSTFVFELLATTGVLGFAAFLFLVYKIVQEKNFFLPLLLAVIAAFVLPFSFILVTIFFVLLAVFAVVRTHDEPQRFAEMEFYLVTLRRGLFVALPEGERIPQNEREKRYSRLLPWAFFVFLIVVVGVPFYYSMSYFVSDMVFQKSLVAASQNKGTDTYNLEISAIKTFPYRDVYYRAFSQTNIALANALAVQQQQQNSSPSAQTQQYIVTLIQQGITSGRSATSIAPYTAFNWNNLSSIYRSLIGFGQNADQFTKITLQQAILLDPTNPQQYVELGGVSYQLGQYDDAIQQFQAAINLKKDYANAYYNLGHAYEMKGDYQNALAAYQVVKQLVANDPTNAKKVDDDIAAAQAKQAGQQQQVSAQQQAAQQANDQTLNVNQPDKTLPERNPKVKIPGPTVSPIPTSGAKAKTTPTAAPTEAQPTVNP